MGSTTRTNGYSVPAPSFKGQNLMNHYNQTGQGHSAQYLPRGPPISPQSGPTHLQNLTNSMAALSVHGSYGSSLNSKSGTSAMSANSSEYGGVALAQGQSLWVPNPNLYSVMAGTNHHQQAGMAHSPGVYGHHAGFVPQANYQYGQAIVENSPMATGWASRVSSGDMPALMTPRRDSVSSNENDIPGTPYTGSGMYHYGSTAIIDRSPNGVYTSSATPSPSQLTQYQMVNPMQKQHPIPAISQQLHQLLLKEPAIPRAIPAPSSPLKPLDRSLENKSGETNVYIRGLLPETTDEMLHAWGKRFGDIQSSKSIIDHKTSLCKGYDSPDPWLHVLNHLSFGFIKYHNFEDAENCIRGFHFLGYEVSFARVVAALSIFMIRFH